jgi:hypothetical protein
MVESVIFTLTPLSHAAVEQNKARHANSVVAGTLAVKRGDGIKTLRAKVAE